MCSHSHIMKGDCARIARSIHSYIADSILAQAVSSCCLAAIHKSAVIDSVDLAVCLKCMQDVFVAPQDAVVLLQAHFVACISISDYALMAVSGDQHQHTANIQWYLTHQPLDKCLRGPENWPENLW